MSIVYLYEPFCDFDHFLDEAFSTRFGGAPSTQVQTRTQSNYPDSAARVFKPRTDLREDAEKNVVTATFDFPGLKKEDVQIDVHNGYLAVSANAKLSAERLENDYAIRERQYGKFLRTLQLPQGVKLEEISASMENGLLEITYPKTASKQAPKKIAIA